MNEYRRVLILAGLILFASSCTIAGDTVMNDRNLSDFDRIHMKDSGNLILVQGSEESVIVETDEDALGDIVTSVRNRVLTLGYHQKSLLHRFRAPEPLNYHVSIVNLRGIEISGSGSIQAESIVAEELDMKINGSGSASIKVLTASDLDVRVNGSGEFDLTGGVKHQMINISGSGQYRAGSLLSETADVNIAGSGEVSVNAGKVLKVNVSGSGLVEYSGSPNVTVDIRGSGRAVSLDSN